VFLNAIVNFFIKSTSVLPWALMQYLGCTWAVPVLISGPRFTAVLSKIVYGYVDVMFNQSLWFCRLVKLILFEHNS
jgi:hypothetical protein